MNAFRQALLRHRFFVHLFLATQLLVWIEAPQALEAQELRQEQEQRAWQATVRAIGLPEDFGRSQQDDDPGRLTGIIGSADAQIRELASKLRPTAAGSALAKPPVASVGEAGSDSVEQRLAKLQPTKPRPVLRRSAAPPRAVGAIDVADLEAGDAVTTRAPGLRPVDALDEAFTKRRSADLSSLAAGLPTRTVERKARTLDSSRVAAPDATLGAVAKSAAMRHRPVEVVTKSVDPTIDALAASLDDSPGEIFTFVHDSIDYDPKWGADSPPVGTLWEGAGTSWDQAWLLQELLLAAGVDARLEWGTVQIDTPLLLEITGIDDPVRAGDFLATAGLDVLLIVQGSEVIAARFPHVWVKAHLDYIPNRGAGTFVAGTGDTWIRMDPSLKTFERVDGTRIDQDVAFDLGQHLTSATPLTPREDYDAAVTQHIADVGLGIALDEAKARRSVRAEDFPFVPGTLRAKVVDLAAEAEAIPASHQVRLDLRVRTPSGQGLTDWSVPLPSVYGALVELRWPGATAADQATLDLYGGDVYAVPPYDVDLRPSIVVEGLEVATGGSIGSAEDAQLFATLTPPAGLGGLDAADGEGIEIVALWELFAGEHGVLQADLGHLPQEILDAHLLAAANATEPQDLEASSLAAAASTYLHALGDDLAHVAPLRWSRALHFGSMVFAVQRGAVAAAPDGTPQVFSQGPLSLDVGARQLAFLPVDGVQSPDNSSTVPTFELLGAQGSVREGEALASVFGGDHVTAVGFLKQAVTEGQTLTRVDSSNVEDALAAAVLSTDAEGAIRFAVDRGAVAWISETQLEIGGWRTTGYIIEDPATGAGGYFVTFERYIRAIGDGAVTFHAPLDLDVVTAPTDVVATIDAEGVETWTLSTRPVGGSASTVIATGPGPVEDAILGQFDPTLLLNGLHDIVLTGRTAAGQTVSGKITVAVEGNMKIGHFTLSFVDLAVPLSGLDIEIVRTYDSRQRLEQGDFGYGWTLDIRQGSYKNNRPPGDGWQILPTGGPLGLPCQQISETKSHLTTIRLSDREVYRFRQRLNRPVITIGGCFATAVFDFVDGPLPGSTLEVIGNDEVFFGNGSDHVLDVDSLEVFEPTDVKLTTRDGRIFILDLEDGVTYLEDLNGNSLDITLDGITHSSGVGVDFDRDAEGRITTISNPLGNDTSYSYDAAGDLTVFTEGNATDTRFSYVAEHYLEDVIDPLGIRGVRNEYDSEGRLVRVIDASGQPIDFDHDLDGRREVATNRLGFARILQYDNRGNITSERDELGNVTLRTFDSKDRLLTETDPLGHTTTNTYNSQGDLTSRTDPAGQTTTYSYDSKGRLIQTRDPLGFTTEQTYDSVGNLSSATDAEGFETTFDYDREGNLTEITDPLGETLYLAYDSTGQLVSELAPGGSETVHAYDDNGNISSTSVSRTLPDGSSETLVTEFEYDDFGRIEQTILPDGSTFVASYSARGEILGLTDVLGLTRSLTYDDRGNLIGVTLPDGRRETRVYDAENRMLSLTDSMGRVTSYSYDAAGRLVSTTLPNSEEVETVYDSAGRLVSSTDERGATTTFAYDSVGRRTEEVDPLGNRKVFAYDAVGRLVSATDELSQTTSYEYTPTGRPSLVRYPDGSTKSYRYNARGDRIAAIDEAGVETLLSYDAAGRLVQVEDGLGAISRYEYDELGQRVAQIDANGHTTRFVFDQLGRIVRKILPDESSDQRSFDPAGNLLSYVDFKGQETSFVYDSKGQLTQRIDPGGVSTDFSYSSTGQRISATDSRGTTAWVYDAEDRLIAQSDPEGRELRYTYGTGGELTALTADLGAAGVWTTQYEYDLLGRLTAVTDPQGDRYPITRDAIGNRESIGYPNGVTTSYGWDSRNRLVDLETSRTEQTETLQSFSYDLKATGHRESVTEHDGTTRSYTYDLAYRVLSETVAGPISESRTFTYDAVGNRLTRSILRDDGSSDTLSYQYDVRDRLVNFGAADLTWDLNGNVVDRGETAFAWNSQDQLKEVTLANGDRLRHDYDVDGARIRTEVELADGSQVGRNFLVDSSGFLSHIVAETDDNGDLVAYYVRAGDELLALIRPSSKRFFHADGHGSIRALTDESGVVTDRWSFSPFGELENHTGSDENPYLFNGQRYQDEAGLYDLRARWMDPKAARFLSTDPFPGDPYKPSSLHRYSYAANDGINNSDPSGLFSVGIGGFSLSISISGVLSTMATGALFGAAFGAADAYFAETSITDGIIQGALIGAFLGPLGKIKKLQRFLLYVGTFLAGTSTFQAYMDGDVGLALFRGIFFVAGARAVVTSGIPAGFPGRRAPPSTPKPAPTPPPNTGDVTVYRSFGPNGEIQYVGITKNLAARSRAHLRKKGIEIEPIDDLQNLSRADARSVEQVLIEYYGFKKTQGTLLNLINSIAKTNPSYASSVARGRALLAQIGYPGF